MNMPCQRRILLHIQPLTYVGLDIVPGLDLFPTGQKLVWSSDSNGKMKLVQIHFAEGRRLKN